MLTRIDELNLPDHHHLDGRDNCYFIGEYTAGRGYTHSATNQLVLNLKKGVERRGRPEWMYKEHAIQVAGVNLRNSLNPDFLRDATFVPVPPSRIATDPLYDDRIVRVLRHLGPNVDVRTLVLQTENMLAAHDALHRPGPRSLYERYEIDEDLVDPPPSLIAVVDDVLTTGSHFKAMKMILEDAFEDVPVVGLFLARRVPDTE